MAFGSSIIEEALRRPAGARFYKCALQGNPFEYYKRHNKGTLYTTEDAFNSAIVDALVSAGVEVIAITDHYRISTGTKLAAAARARGLVVFNGFEAVTKDGVHVLCLFDPNEDTRKIDRFIGDCGVHDQSQLSPAGDLDADELLTACREKWNGICVAAHVCSTGGLLTTLRGQAAIRAWTHK